MSRISSPRPTRKVFFIQNGKRQPVNEEEELMAQLLAKAKLQFAYEPDSITVEHHIFEPSSSDDDQPICRVHRTCVAPDFRINYSGRYIYLELKHNTGKGYIGRLRDISRARCASGLILMLIKPKIIHTDLPIEFVANLLRRLKMDPHQWTICKLIPRAA